MLEWIKTSRDTKAFLLYLAAVIIIYAPVVLGGKTLQPSMLQPHGLVDGISYGYTGRLPINTFDVDLPTPAWYEWPVNRLVGDIYKKGSLPLWNPYQAAGTPLAADYSSRAFFPYQILEDISPVNTWDFFYLGRALIAGFFTYLFLSAMGLSFGAAFIGGLFYMFSGLFTWFINLEQMANVAMSLPVLFYALERLIKRGGSGLRETAFVGIATALVLTGGQPEVALYIFLLAGSWFVFRALQRDKTLLLPLIAKAVLAFVIGLALASPLILPFLSYVKLSHNIHPPGSGVGVMHLPDWRAILNILVPTATELPIDPALLGGGLHKLAGVDGAATNYYRTFAVLGNWDYLGGYTGVLSIFLSVAGLVTALRTRAYARGPATFFFTGFALVIILKNLGLQPFLWLGYLPLFDLVWSPRWSAPTWIFALSVAGALGFESLVAWRGVEKESTGPRGTGAYVAIAAAAVVVLALIAIKAPMVVSMAMNVERLSALLLAPYVIPAVLFGHLQALFIVVAAVAVAFYHAKTGRGIYGLIALAALELWWDAPRGYDHAWLYWKTLPFAIGIAGVFLVSMGKQRLASAAAIVFCVSFFLIDSYSPYGLAERTDPFKETPPYVNFLKERAGHYRVMGGYGVLYPNYASAVGIYDLRYVNSLVLKGWRDFRYSRLQAPVRHEDIENGSLWFTGMPQRIVSRPGGGGIEFTYKGIENDIVANLNYYSLMGVKFVLMPSWFSLDSTGRATGLDLIYDKEVKIYENPHVLPRAFTTTQERDAGRLDPDSVHEALIKDYAPNHVEIEVELDGPGTLVLSDAYDPGWKVSVNGVSGEIVRTNPALRQVLLSGGRNEVVFSYRPRGFVPGLVLAGMAASLTIVMCVRRRRG